MCIEQISQTWLMFFFKVEIRQQQHAVLLCKILPEVPRAYSMKISFNTDYKFKIIHTHTHTHTKPRTLDEIKTQCDKDFIEFLYLRRCLGVHRNIWVTMILWFIINIFLTFVPIPGTELLKSLEFVFIRNTFQPHLGLCQWDDFWKTPKDGYWGNQPCD